MSETQSRDALTERQREVLKVLEGCEYPPTYRELSGLLGISSPAGCIGHIKALIRKGYVERQVDQSRSIRVIYKWHKHVPLIVEMANWYTQFNPCQNDLVIDMFHMPEKYEDLWKDFCEAMPGRIAELQGKYRWRLHD